MIYKTKVQKVPDADELFIEFPDELMKELGWKVGDVLVWEETEMLAPHGEFPGASLCSYESLSSEEKYRFEKCTGTTE